MFKIMGRGNQMQIKFICKRCDDYSCLVCQKLILKVNELLEEREDRGN